jgi:hypothetical protein
LAAEFVATEARYLDDLRRFLADDEIDRPVGFAGAVADVLVGPSAA